jgi:hypothetical protein
LEERKENPENPENPGSDLNIEFGKPEWWGLAMVPKPKMEFGGAFATSSPVRANRKNLFSLVAKEDGYKGQEIAEYLWGDPASVTGCVRERKRFEADIEKVHDMLRNRSGKFNN